MRYELPVIARAVDGVMGIQLKALAQLLGPVAMPEPAKPDTDAGVEEPADAAKPDEAVEDTPEPAKSADKPAEKAPAAKPKVPSVDDVFGDLVDEDKP
jgi:hypothetical protein